MSWFLGILFVLILVGLSVSRKIFIEKEAEHTTRENAIQKWPVHPYVKHVLVSLIVICFGIGIFNFNMFYSEPSMQYHVRTILGNEWVFSGGTGYKPYLMGRINEWKRALSVQAISEATGSSDDMDGAEKMKVTSSTLSPQKIIFLDQVDSDATFTVRFRLPSDEVKFLELVHEYRTPTNLLNTELNPAVKETIQATASLMTAEKYFSGGRTEFMDAFENQMENGIYLVERKEEVEVDKTATIRKGSAAADAGANQQSYGDAKKVVFKVEKLYEKDGVTPKRKLQNFRKFGIELVSARVTDIVPNDAFRERMRLKQQASADRAIAREDRIKEEQQKLLAIAKGEREVAEEQAKAKKIQIKRTTDAETDKRLTLIEANKLKEQADIARQTSATLLAKAKIDAESVKVTADAEAYKKKVVLKADNALAQKLEAEIAIQKVWAEAYARRQVPTNVFGAGADTPSGSDSEAKTFMQIMTMDAATRLNYNRGLSAQGTEK
jgi:regulator of protease activity HflC (stomatin/prohibitin superfamily)